MKRRGCGLGLVGGLVALLVWTVALGAPAAAAARRWSLEALPADVTQPILLGVAVAHWNSVWAVGSQTTTGPAVQQPLAERWDGREWATSPVAPKANAQLRAVVALSDTNVWAAGYVLIEHWNGTAWSIVPYQVDPGTPDEGFTGMAATSSRDIWAIGPSQVEHWDGKSWSQAAFPVGLSPAEVDADSPTDAWIVGVPDVPGGPMSAHWDGHRWTLVDPPVAPGSPQYLGYGVRVVSPDDVWAVGTDTDAEQAMTFHWDGTSWQAVPLPGAPDRSALQGTVSLLPDGDLWAAGDRVDGTIVHPLLARWSAHTGRWSVQAGAPGTDTGTYDWNGTAVARRGDVFVVGFGDGQSEYSHR